MQKKTWPRKPTKNASYKSVIHIKSVFVIRRTFEAVLHYFRRSCFKNVGQQYMEMQYEMF